MKPKKMNREKFWNLMTTIQNKEIMITAKLIFDEIDNAIEECKSKSPATWDKSQFRKLYEEIKSKWTTK